MSFFNSNATGLDKNSTFGGFDFDQDSGYGGFSVDNSGAFDLPGLGGSGALSPGGLNQYVDTSYGEYNPVNSNSSLNKILEALTKASAYKAQSGSAPSFKGAGAGTSVEKVGNSSYLINRAPRIKTTGGSSGGGLGSAIGDIAGTALSFIPGVGPVARALLPKVGSTVGGLFG